MSKALDDVAAERQRQIEVEGYTYEKDDGQSKGQLGLAAIAYLFSGLGRYTFATVWWPFMSPIKPKSHRQDLVRGVAFGLAEIERLDRLEDPA